MHNLFINFFNNAETNILSNSLNINPWNFVGGVIESPRFWYKELMGTPALDLFTNKIKNILQKDISIYRLYANGQAHSQCGFWHQDARPGSRNHFTVVYFNKDWLPEYGGHLLIKTDKVDSIIPEYNKAVLFDSTLDHMGMEPTVFCKTQRESIACKFRIINE